MKTVNGHWGKIFKEKMKEQGITREELATKSDIPIRTLDSYLSGATEPTVSKFCIITNILNIKL